MGGLYACVNPDCKKHKDIRIDLGALTTNAQMECSECGSKLIEVNRCGSCGNLLLVGQTDNNDVYGFTKRQTQSLFEIDNDDNSSEEKPEQQLDDAVDFVFAKGVAENLVRNSRLIQKKLMS